MIVLRILAGCIQITKGGVKIIRAFGFPPQTAAELYYGAVRLQGLFFGKLYQSAAHTVSSGFFIDHNSSSGQCNPACETTP